MIGGEHVSRRKKTLMLARLSVWRPRYRSYHSPFTVHRSPFTVHRSPFTAYRLPITGEEY